MSKLRGNLKEELKFEIIGIFLFSFAVLCIVTFFSPVPGTLGSFLTRFLRAAAGKGAFLIPLFIGFFGARMILQRKSLGSLLFNAKAFGFIFLFCVTLTLLHFFLPADVRFSPDLKIRYAAGYSGLGGGIIGVLLASFLFFCFGTNGSYLILAALTVIGLLLVTDRSLLSLLKKVKDSIIHLATKLKEEVLYFFALVKHRDEYVETEQGDLVIYSVRNLQDETEEKVSSEFSQDIPANYAEDKQATAAELRENLGNVIEISNFSRNREHSRDTNDGTLSNHLLAKRYENYQLPPLSLLRKAIRIKHVKNNKDIVENSQILEETLETFGIKVKVTSVSQGPAITRYEIQPPPGVKVSRIVNLADDIALKMAATDIRIEAPIPGKAAIGIEIPNKEVAPVYLREVLETSEFQNSASQLTIGLGKDIGGLPVCADLVKMPHLLIAGATGSGKSVCINSLISSVLFKAKPEEVKFLMIDPKMVELANYNGIPHLIAPVITDPKKAAAALKWVVQEMEHRYNLFAAEGVRDIKRYNELIAKENKDASDLLPLPYVVVIIDELADLMMIAPADVEEAICRLAQMARAAGIHLVVATQRPSVDVITGIIKANIPSRIAFAVSSQVDSRTILDIAGAEKLLGRGDMLFFPVGASKPLRVQGAFISDAEVEELVRYVTRQGKPEYLQGIFNAEVKEAEPTQAETDELFEEAVRLVLETKQASISMLQRKFRIGYTRAARLIDLMEEKKIIGPFEGSKPREVLLTPDQYYRLIKNK